MEKSNMRRAKLKLKKSNWSGLSLLAAVAFLFAASFPARSLAQQKGQKTFSSPEEASAALFAAVHSNDEKALLDIFGPDGKQIVYSGDATEDAQSHANFAQKYQEMHRLVKEPDGTICLYIGAMNWPTPIPIVNSGNSWYFNAAAGKKEILARRVGRNEMSAIHVCQELAAAEKEYRSTHNGMYAEQIFSDPGKDNGLYWKASEGQPQSPIGPLVAAAVAEGYVKGENGPPTPYRGYYFHVITRQGKNAPGGAKDYIANGKMTEGFAIVAYPAEYRSSGVTSFIVGQDAVVYQKDLGKNTETIAKAIKEYNPNASWQKSEQETEESAAAQK
jgi:hypothetical protein